MSNFLKITVALIVNDESFAMYLFNSSLKTGRSGGTFVGTYEKAPNCFKKYGIILPKGGMIIPDIQPDVLGEYLAQGREILISKQEEFEKALQKENQKEEERAEETFLEEVTILLQKFNIPDLHIVGYAEEKGENIPRSLGYNPLKFLRAYENRFERIFNLALAYGQEMAFLLRVRDERCGLIYEASLNIVEIFLDEEEENNLIRKKHHEFLESIREKRGIEFDSFCNSSWGALAVGPRSVHDLSYKGQTFYIDCEDDMENLQKIITEENSLLQIRREKLWNLFSKDNGVFTKKEKSRSCHAGTSMASGRAKWDEWIETIYSIGGEEITDEEYRWLNNGLHAIEIPAGYCRVRDGLNSIQKIIYPQDKDILEVWGKIGRSRRGVDPTGIIYKGSPGKCPVDLIWRSNAPKKWTLNGKEMSNRFDIEEWNEPYRMAQRAIEQFDIPDPYGKVAVILAACYKKNLK